MGPTPLPYFVYITASSREEALAIGRTLVEERLAACINVLDGMTSLYWWEGKIEQGNEAVLIAKTRDENVEPLTERVKSLHSYSVPCVIAWPIKHGNDPYIDWIEENSLPPEDDPSSRRRMGFK
ncbi:MAG: divalent-cation tolerance protein CutA [Planctomycetaceae bacterium]